MLRARDGASAEVEKQLAYKRIDTLLKDLITVEVPERAKELLAQEQQLSLEKSIVQQPGTEDRTTV